MRVGILVVGVVVAIIGAVLLFVPLTPQSNQTTSTSSSTPFELLSVSGYSITGSIPVGVSWTATSSVIVVGAACTAVCSSANLSSITGITTQSGTAGSFTLNQPNGGQVILGVVVVQGPPSGNAPATVTFKVTTGQATVGTALLVVGIIVLILGAVLRPRKANIAAAVAPNPSASPATPAMGGAPPGPPLGPT